MHALPELTVTRGELGAGELDAIAGHVATTGAVVLRSCERRDVAAALRAEGERLLHEDLAAGTRHPGVVYALMTRSRLFLEHMARPLHLALFRRVLGHGCIVHHHCLSAVPPAAGQTYATELHRDVPASRCIPGYPTNLGLFVALEDMDTRNGAVQMLPRSHQGTSMPTEKEFGAAMVSPSLRQGDAVFFDARIVHRGGSNATAAWRLALSLHACRAYMRQLFDYPRMLSAADLAALRPEQAQFLGCWVRMPASLAEFHLPAEQRPYRPGQE